jgi:hypothetical protein
MAVIHKDVGRFSAEAYSPNGELLGVIETTCELDDFRLQVCREHVAGYYLMFNGEKLELNEYANMPHWPREFDFDSDCCSEILKIQFGYHEKENSEGVG